MRVGGESPRAGGKGSGQLGLVPAPPTSCLHTTSYSCSSTFAITQLVRLSTVSIAFADQCGDVCPKILLSGRRQFHSQFDEPAPRTPRLKTVLMAGQRACNVGKRLVMHMVGARAIRDGTLLCSFLPDSQNPNLPLIYGEDGLGG